MQFMQRETHKDEQAKRNSFGANLLKFLELCELNIQEVNANKDGDAEEMAHSTVQYCRKLH